MAGLADAQAVIFLSVAAVVSCLGGECAASGAGCSVYYPAAMYGPAAAVGSIVWAWVMYLSCLGALVQGGGVSLGLQGMHSPACMCMWAGHGRPNAWREQERAP